VVGITKAHHTGLTVASLQRSLAFYCGILGFEVLFQWNPREPYLGELVGYPDVDMHAAIVRLPGTDVALELLEYRNVDKAAIDPANANPGTSHLAFFVDSLDEYYEELCSRGVAAVSPPVTPTIGPNKGGRAVYMIDPDGFRVELIETAGGFADYSPGLGSAR
jgi:lactoylglutathione lyase